jgi:hypothetical protein
MPFRKRARFEFANEGTYAVPLFYSRIAWKDGSAETHDDWSCATFSYEPVPSARLPTLPDVKARTADLGTE